MDREWHRALLIDLVVEARQNAPDDLASFNASPAHVPPCSTFVWSPAPQKQSARRSAFRPISRVLLRPYNIAQQDVVQASESKRSHDSARFLRLPYFPTRGVELCANFS
jgi:hypothetical protein